MLTEVSTAVYRARTVPLRRLPVLLTALAGLALPAPSSAATGVDTTCLLPVTRVDSATVNVAFPDEAALYWAGAFSGVPGSRLRIEGRFPHARYFSFNLYDPALRPTAVLTDRDLEPDPGSTNPFRPGADRTARDRSYTAFVVPGRPPARPAPNTAYAGDQLAGTFLLRLYVPDRDRGETGGVGLPRVTLEVPGGPDRRISLVDCTAASKPTGDAANRLVAELSPPAPLDAVPYPGRRWPVFQKFVNLTTAVFGFTASTDGLQGAYEALVGSPLAAAGGQGGFLSNLDNAYVSTVVNRAYGQVLVVRGRAPRTPDTRGGARRMPTDVDLRYFSLCQNEFVTQRFVACRTDDQTVLDDDGWFTYVVSTAAQRPANARAACGVTWLPWGPIPEGVLILRHMLPEPGFAAAIQRATFRKEADTMGDVLPRAQYLPDRAAFERRGCEGAAR